MTESAPGQWFFESYSDFGRRWERSVNLSQSNIRFTQPVYRDLGRQALEAVKSLANSSRKTREHLQKVQKVDSETIELVFAGPSDQSSTEYSYGARRAEDLRDELESFFGAHWRAEQKIDRRYESNRHPGRVVVRCVEAYRFKYELETSERYQRALHGSPEGVPEDAWMWRDVFPSSPEQVDKAADLWVYETSSGTQHFVPAESFNYGGWVDGFFSHSVVKPVSLPCGHQVEPSAVVDEFEHFRHYAVAHAKEVYESKHGDEFHDFEEFVSEGAAYALDPRAVLDNPCRSCLRSYGVVKKGERYDGEKVTMPSFKYGGLVQWGVENDD